jgi:hypothetical protein
MRSSAFNLSGGDFLISRDLFVSTFVLLAVAVPPFYAQTATPASPGLGRKTPQVTLVDIIPESLSGETENDSEPNIAVNPRKPKEIAVSAFTREPMRRADRAPIFVSTDGGNTWSLRSIVPSPEITCDVTLRFGSCSNVLYLSALRNELQGYKKQELMICHSAEYATTRLMGEIFNHRNLIDQPYVAAITVASKDHVFVGNADFNYSNNPKDPNAEAVIDESLDAAHSKFTPLPIDYRPMTKKGDWSEVRSAIAADGNVVYAAFNRVTSVSYEQCRWGSDIAMMTSDVVVVRDDKGGASTRPFSSLVDPKGTPGVVVEQRKLAGTECLGGDRLGDDLAIAVHPTDQNKVYLVWSDLANSRVDLHVKYSTDSGKTWSGSKRDIPEAKNPGLAVNAQGVVGFLYQQMVNIPGGYVWKTQFEQTTDDFKTKPQPLTLAQFPTDAALYQSCCDAILLGDYLHLMSVGKDFYGIFSSDNTPDRSHFPCGITFRRRKDFDSKKLLDLQDHKVAASIDPFFFKITEQ